MTRFEGFTTLDIMVRPEGGFGHSAAKVGGYYHSPATVVTIASTNPDDVKDTIENYVDQVLGRRIGVHGDFRRCHAFSVLYDTSTNLEHVVSDLQLIIDEVNIPPKSVELAPSRFKAGTTYY